MDNLSILVTGGTGTFGRAFIRYVLSHFKPRRLVVFSRDEWKQWAMQQEDPLFRSDRLRYFLGDVRDRERLNRAFQDVDWVVHAAALKQVPAAEYNPSEFVKTNVTGAMNVIEAAIDCGVKRVLALSTDKAVNPVNLYGATKLCSDKLFVAGNVYVGARGHPRFSVMRYGNVIASRGSVISHWQDLISRGAKELPITDPNMTRFWITQEQAVRFVLAAFATMEGGEIFVPKCPSMKIADLVEALAPGLSYRVDGVRPGEKLHELLIAPEDAENTREYVDHYTIRSTIYSAPTTLGGQSVPSNFSYASHLNDRWLTQAQLRDCLTRGI